jgi:hypothetical protein
MLAHCPYFLHVGISCLDERGGVKAPLASHLEPDLVTGLGVPCRLGTGLDFRVDLVVVRGGEHAQVVGGGDGGGVLGHRVSDRSGVSRDGSLLDIISGFRTNQETLVSQHGVDGGGRPLEEIEEGTAVEVGLLEVQVGLGAVGLGLGQVVSDQLSLEALGELVVEFDLGVQDIGGGPSLGEGQACASVKHQQSRPTRREEDLMSRDAASAQRGTDKEE